MSKRLYYSYGFTLIEVVIVIAMIGIISALVITSLATSRSAREADRVSRTFAAALREAQNYALSGRDTTAAQENCFYGVRITSATTYSLVNYYRLGGVCSSSYGTLSTITLPSGVQFAGITSYPTVFAFALPRAEVAIATTGTPTGLGSNQRIGFIKNSQTMWLCLYPSGRIEERGATGSCP